MAERTTEPDERTYEPTTMRLAEARRRGQIPRSADLTSAAAVLAGLLVLGVGGRGLLEHLASMTASLLDGRGSAGRAGAWTDPARDDVAGAAGAAVGATASRAGALAAVLAGLVALAALVQVGPVVATERVKADWSRVSPSAGWRRLKGPRTKMRALLAVLKPAAACGVAWWAARPMLGRIAATPRLDSWSLAVEAGRMALTATFYAALSLLLLGGAEYLYQRWQHRCDLRMTRREWMEDMIRSEGRPEVRSRRKKRAAETQKRREGAQ